MLTIPRCLRVWLDARERRARERARQWAIAVINAQEAQDRMQVQRINDHLRRMEEV